MKNLLTRGGRAIVRFTVMGKSRRQPFLAFIFALSVVGCATQPQIEYRVADVPEPPTVNRPELPVLAITKDMDPGTIVQLHRETIKRLQAWGLELEAALNAYRKKAP
jgi:hypothetical protein